MTTVVTLRVATLIGTLTGGIAICAAQPLSTTLPPDFKGPALAQLQLDDQPLQPFPEATTTEPAGTDRLLEKDTPRTPPTEPLAESSLTTLEPASAPPSEPEGKTNRLWNLSRKFGWESQPKVEFATFRSSGNIYFKGKAGFDWGNNYRTFDEVSFSEIVDLWDENAVFGLGAGYKLGNGDRVEIEVTVDKQEEQFLRFGYSF